jgi:hypothetical protein
MLFSAYALVLVVQLVSLCSCQRNTVTVAGVTISWENLGSRTVFNASSPLGNGVNVNNAWLGIGVNTRTGMVTKHTLKRPILEICN